MKNFTPKEEDTICQLTFDFPFVRNWQIRVDSGSLWIFYLHKPVLLDTIRCGCLNTCVILFRYYLGYLLEHFITVLSGQTFLIIPSYTI